MSIIELKKLTKVYTANNIINVALNEINASFDIGEFIVITGESGSGKSTLLNVLGANDTYEQGEYYFNNEKTSAFNDEQWNKFRDNNISMIFQDFNIIESLTVKENIEIALLRYNDKKQRETIANHLVKIVGLSHVIKNKGGELSGGEKQRVAIARGLAKGTPILLADEPTGNLDATNSRKIAKLLKEISAHKLVIVVTHNFEYFQEYATRKIVLKDGKILSDELVDNINNNEPVFDANNIVEQNQIDDKSQTNNAKNKINILKKAAYLGVLNYRAKSRISLMLTCTTLLIATAMFMIISFLSSAYLRSPSIKIHQDDYDNKVIVNSENLMSHNHIDKFVRKVHPLSYVYNADKTNCVLQINKNTNEYELSSDYQIRVTHNPKLSNQKGKGVLLVKYSYRYDANKIKQLLIDSLIDVNQIDIKYTLTSKEEVHLFLSSYDIENNYNFLKILLNKFNINNTSYIAQKYICADGIKDNEVKLLNSKIYNANNNYLKLFNNKQYKIIDDQGKYNNAKGVVICLSKNEYNRLFSNSQQTKAFALYFNNSKDKTMFIDAFNNASLGKYSIIDTNQKYLKDNASDIASFNIMVYLAIIFVIVLITIILCFILNKGFENFIRDFVIYKTLGIMKSVYNLSFSIYMLLIFVPTLIILPIISLLVAIIPGSTISFINPAGYFFIEIMILVMLRTLNYFYNLKVKKSAIKNVLVRGNK